MATITAVDVIPYALPFKEPYVTARGRLERREMVLVRLRTDAGIDGLGEAVPLALRGGASLDRIERELREVAAPRLIGSEAAGGVALSGLSMPALAAVQTASLDLEARLADRPAWSTLGAKAPEPVRCNATLVAGPPTTVATAAERWAERGFTSFKLKVGVPGDVEQVAAVRAAVGAEARIRVDANGVWSPREALERLAAMEPHRLELAEQPAGDLEELALVREQTAVPIAADESVVSPDDAHHAVELGACALATVKLAKVGGVGIAREIAEELPVYLSSALDGPVGIAAAAHAAQALRGTSGDAGIAHGLATGELFANTIASTACSVRDGSLHLAEGPGLGVEIDEQALDRHRL